MRINIIGNNIMKKNCLNCKFEPDWGNWVTAGYKRCYGKCKWNNGIIPTLPQVYNITEKFITRYGDDSGTCQYCKTWQPKKS